MQNTKHPDDAAVDALATAMKAKLAKQRAKGYGGWDDKVQCSQQFLSALLRRHVDKGDPVDVANFCAFLLARGEAIAAAQQAVQAAVPLPMVELFGVKDGQETSLGTVPMPPTMRARELLQDIGFRGLDDDDGDGAYAMAACEQLIEYCKAYYEAPAHPAEGAPAPEVSAEKITPDEWREVVHSFWIRNSRKPLIDDAEFLNAIGDVAVRKYAATHPTQQGMDAQDAIRALIAQHGKELEKNEYAYFELAYTRSTGWMAWITDKPLCSPVVNPDRKVLASGQGDTPEAACADALAAQAKQGGA